MKKLLVFFIAIALASGMTAQEIQPRPTPPRAVNDFGDFLEPFQEEALEQKLRAYNDSTSSAIIIVTVPSLEGYAIAPLALKYSREWGIGQKGKDNGVLILVAKKEKKARIEVGFGLEGAIPDITAKRIIEDEMLPNFRADDYYAGFDAAVDALIAAAAGEYQASPRKKDEGPGIGTIIFMVIIFIGLIFFISRKGGGGGGGGSYMSRKGSRSFMGALPWFLMGGMLGRGSSGGFGGGGFGGGGGGFGGGGFGGFGGGGFGGGGASGGW